MSEPTSPQPFPSWTWFVNELGEGMWVPPTPHPMVDQVPYYWDEESLSWKEA